ncbi:MAG: hypothetical protein BEN19_06905 [Epulopiscium sp. Nuni2H_MBin003]|nr:MAG: hypothetical protein BEN19_06905 [Epulopiscium sp. Nuni2H_MBin003]
MKIRYKLSKNSIMVRLAAVILLAILLQSLFAVGVIMYSQVSNTLVNYAYNAFSQTVTNRKNLLQSIMINRWSFIEYDRTKISADYQRLLSNEEQDYSANVLDFLSESVNSLMDMMVKTDTTGAFIILNDGADAANLSTLYLRKENYLSTLSEVSDLTMVRGPSEISKQHKIILTNTWSYGITLTEDNVAILENPFLATTLTDNSAYWGYWHISSDISNPRSSTITYSVPIMNELNEPVGIIGVEISEQYLYSQLPANELASTGSYGYIGAHLEQGALIPLINNGTLQQLVSPVGQSIPLVSLSAQHDNFDPVKIVYGGKQDIAIYFEEIRLYASNSPFNENSLFLVGMVDIANITSLANNLNDMLVLMVIVSLSLGLIIAILFARNFAKPIIALNHEILNFNLDASKKFRRTKLIEIDDLSTAIEDLNYNILNSAYKTDKILDLLNLNIGSFEYIQGNDYVTLSQTLKKMFKFPSIDEHTITMPKTEFCNFIGDLKAQKEIEFEDIYLSLTDADTWFKIIEVEQNNSLLGVIIDVSEEVLELRTLNYERDHDALTGIFNRGAFDRKSRSIFEAGSIKCSAFVMFDLDNLKYINDTFGHEMGDLYIQTTAQYLDKRTSAHIIVARMGGDEFYMFMHGFDTETEILNIVKGIYTELDNNPLILPDNSKFTISISGGIAYYGTHSIDYDELMKFSDFAMYIGKKSLKGQLKIFDRAIYDSQEVTLTKHEELNKILDNEIIDYLFKPIVSTTDGSIFGYEALMKPRSTIIDSPSKLLELSAQQDKLGKIEQFTFFKTLSLYAKYADYFNGAKLFINSIPNESLSDLEYDELQKEYSEYLQHIVIKIIKSDLELTTSFAHKVDKLKSWSSFIATDNYYSDEGIDLTMLKQGVYLVKVNQLIYSHILEDDIKQEMLRTFIEFCKSNNIKILAEEVKDKEEFEYLITHGIDYIQGFYVSPPLEKPTFDNTDIKRQIDDLLHR